MTPATFAWLVVLLGSLTVTLRVTIGNVDLVRCSVDLDPCRAAEAVRIVAPTTLTGPWTIQT